MSGFVPSSVSQCFTDLDRDEPLGEVAEALRAWEPKLEIELRRGEARPYDADATGYHFVLGVGGQLEVNRRRVPVAAGDLFVLPAGFAIDAIPPIDVLILKHLGTPPRHHRERFLQVQGVDHIPLAGILDGDRSAVSAGTSAHPAHRIGFADAVRLEPGRPAARRVDGSVLELLLLVEGEAQVGHTGGGGVLRGPGLILLGPGTIYEVEGEGVATIWRLPAEPEYEAKRWS